MTPALQRISESASDFRTPEVFFVNIKLKTPSGPTGKSKTESV
jgi:hypothetical protein